MERLWNTSFTHQIKQGAYNTAPVEAIVRSVAHYFRAKGFTKDDCRKLYSGTVVQVEPTAVPRVIGKQGSMITAIREKTHTRIQIGQNGFIWIDGKGEDISRAQKAIETINRETSSEGLTKKIEKLLEK